MAQHRCGHWVRQVLFEPLPRNRRSRTLRRIVLPVLQTQLVHPPICLCLFCTAFQRIHPSEVFVRLLLESLIDACIWRMCLRSFQQMFSTVVHIHLDC